jgi:hypothetical protein
LFEGFLLLPHSLFRISIPSPQTLQTPPVSESSSRPPASSHHSLGFLAGVKITAFSVSFHIPPLFSAFSLPFVLQSFSSYWTPSAGFLVVTLFLNEYHGSMGVFSRRWRRCLDGGCACKLNADLLSWSKVSCRPSLLFPYRPTPPPTFPERDTNS